MDNTGTRFDFTVTAGMPEELVWEFMRADGAALDLSGATFEGVVVGPDGAAVTDGMHVEHGAEAGLMAVTVKDMAAGVYRYEVYATSPDMERARVLYGALTAVSSEAALLRIQDAVKHAYRTLRVMVPDEVGGPLLLSWLGSTAAGAMARAAAASAEGAAASADAARAAADGAESAVREAAAGVVEQAQGYADSAGASAAAAAASASQAAGHTATARRVVELWEAKMERVAWCNPETGTWWVYDVDTHAVYRGEDGKSPYIQGGTWWVWDSERACYVDSGESVRGADGHSPYVSAAGNWVRWDDDLEGWVDTGVRALGRDGRDGDSVQRHLVAAVEEIPTSGPTCNGGHYYYVPHEAEVEGGRDFYDVYAWFDGEGWVLVGERNDVATSELLGLSRLGTDSVVNGGAPVGMNEQKQLRVPRGDYATPGVLSPSYSGNLGSGGMIGSDANGRLWAQKCTVTQFGAGKPSYGGVAEVACVGLMADGSYGIPWASYTQPGVSRLGSYLSEKNSIPYIMGVGGTSNHELANNLLTGGAFQHQKPPAWVQKGMAWLDGQRLNNDCFYAGLCTSASFTQSQTEGLELVHATEELLGGVRMAAALTSGDGGVPTGGMVYDYLAEHYYPKGQVYTKVELDATFMTIAEAERRYCCFDKEYHEQVLQRCEGIANRAEAECTRIKDAAESSCRAISASSERTCSGIAHDMQEEADKLLKKTPGLERIEVLTSSQYAELSRVDEGCLYLITPNQN